MLGASWRRYEDPSRSRDPRVRELVASLANLPAPELRAEFRAELRAQLVAIAPRYVAEGLAATAPMVDIVPRPAPRPSPRPSPHPTPKPRAAVAAPTHHTDTLLDRLRRIPIGRPLAVVASVITVFALLLGGAVWMSKKALPGDSLYGLKRASERFELATAGSDHAKASDYLNFAATRANEVRELLSRTSASAAGSGLQAAGGVDAGTAKLITSTLSSADADVKSASSLLGKQAVRSGSVKPLSTMTNWAPTQVARLSSIAAAMPAGALRTRAQSSEQLVTAALSRAETLTPKIGCSCLSSAHSDDLGPVPCPVCSSSAAQPTSPGGGQGTSAPGRSSHGRAGSGTSGPGGAVVAPRGGSAKTPGAPATTPKPTSGGHTTFPVHLPTPIKSLPVSVNSCGIGASLGPIGIGIGLCPISIGLTLHP
jgi:hypothetical protein